MTRGAVDRDSSIAMAAHTKSHLERRCFLNNFHLLHQAVTALATNARFDVALVIEANMFRQVIDRIPFDRFLLIPMFFNNLDLRRLGKHGLMATHASFQRGDCRVGRFCNTGVTIGAFDLQLIDVKLVAVENRLLGAISAFQIGFKKHV